MSGPRQRRQPERTCVGCRAHGSKFELVRVVRLPDGRVEVDPSGKAPGRGAYVHRSRECVRKAATGGLVRALRAPVPPQAVRLMEELIEPSGDVS